MGFAEYEGERDEITWARELADELHIENNSKHISEEEYWASLPRVQWHMDEPSADPSAVALYFVDQEAAKKVKAVLSGEAADEFFGGYRIYQTPFANQKLAWAPKGLLRGASKAARALGVRGANYLERASETPEDWYYTNANGVAFSPEERERLRAGKRAEGSARPAAPQELIAPAYAEVAGLDETTRMQYVDLYFWLVGDILLKTDKMSMAHSLESRVPFLDKRVFEVSATIPTRLKANGEQTKLTLREAAERAIPKDWAQKEKLGFPVPVVNWLRQDRYYDEIKEWFTGDIAARFFNTDELVRLLDEHKAGADRSRKIWIVYMFLMWYKIHFRTRRPRRSRRRSERRSASRTARRFPLADECEVRRPSIARPGGRRCALCCKTPFAGWGVSSLAPGCPVGARSSGSRSTPSSRRLASARIGPAPPSQRPFHAGSMPARFSAACAT